MQDCRHRDARVGERVTGPRGDDQFCWVEGDELFECYLVVSVSGDVFDSKGHDVFNDIVCETRNR